MNCPVCNTDIDNHPANRCLDAWVAEKVMGWDLDKVAREEFISYRRHNTGIGMTGQEEYNEKQSRDRMLMLTIPYYSTDITAAWKVIDRLDELYSAWFEIRGPRVWLARCNLPGYEQFSATGLANASLAICRAALKAMKGDSDE